MSSEKIGSGRRQHMLKVAAEAPAIRASKTDRVEKSSWPSKTIFFRDYPPFSDDGRPWKDDDQYIDAMALVVVDDFPSEILNDILRTNAEEAGEPCLWLADSYDTLPDWDPENPTTGTSGAVSETWRSPFVGLSIQDIATFIEAAPKPPKPLCKSFFAVLRREQYEQHKQLSIYKIIDGSSDSLVERELQTVPCPIHLAGFFFMSYDRYYWGQAVQEQALWFNEGAYWSDDDGDNQIFALVVLDDIPTETLDKILDDNEEVAGHPCLWLADDYRNLPDYRPNYNILGTSTPIDGTWRSPFVGKSIEDAANFIRNTPKPPKPLSRRFFAVLQKDFFEQSNMMLICRISPGDLEDEIEGDWNKEQGVQAFIDAGRSLICKAAPDGQSRGAGDGGVTNLTSALQDVNVSTSSAEGDDNKDTRKDEFKVEMIGYPADQVGTFFSASDRFYWWDYGGEDMG